MNETTLLIAQLAGPAFVAVGLGVLVNRAAYQKIYAAMETEMMAMYFVAVSLIVLGTAIVLRHNLWSTPAEIVISLLGWATLLKGLSLTIIPDMMIGLAKSLKIDKMLPLAGVGALVLGGYLVWIGFFL